MRKLPIPFIGAMVRAILREIEQPGTGKTQTRRVLDIACDEPPAIVEDGRIIAFDESDKPYRWPRTKAAGDRLYVREAHYLTDDGDYERAVYAADSEATRDHLATVKRLEDTHAYTDWSRHKRLRPPMHMPRWASRITLIVTDVRVQRLQEISEADAIAEGVEHDSDGWRDYQLPATQCCSTARDSFRTLWDNLNAARGCGWDANPWVAAYTFRPILGNVDTVAP